MRGRRGPEDFGTAFTALLDAAGTNPDQLERDLNGVVGRATLYDWKKGAHLPKYTLTLAEVVQRCLRLAGDGADLNGAPENVQGWLELLAEAKQTRDDGGAAPRRRPASGSSSLRRLNRNALDEVANFLAGRAANLLEELDRLKAASQPTRTDALLDDLKRAKGGYQTPHCVRTPATLPAADLAVAYRHMTLLREYRMILPRRGLVGDPLIDTLEALRGALQRIYDVQIIFAGEIITSTTGNAGPTEQNTPRVSSGPSIDFDPRAQNPIITSVRILPEMASPEIVVEGSPPAAVTPSRSIFVIRVEARALRSVFIDSVRAVVLDRQPPRRACFIRGIGGEVKVRYCDIDFDSENPQMRMQMEPSIRLTVEPNSPQEFQVQAVTATDEITWAIALDWTVNGISGTTFVNHIGVDQKAKRSDDTTPVIYDTPDTLPFSLYPLNVRTGPDGQSLYTTCDHAGHEEGCPALILRQRGESTSTFWSPSDEHRYTGISDLREMLQGGQPEQGPDQDESDAEDDS